MVEGVFKGDRWTEDGKLFASSDLHSLSHSPKVEETHILKSLN